MNFKNFIENDGTTKLVATPNDLIRNEVGDNWKSENPDKFMNISLDGENIAQSKDVYHDAITILSDNEYDLVDVEVNESDIEVLSIFKINNHTFTIVKIKSGQFGKDKQSNDL